MKWIHRGLAVLFVVSAFAIANLATVHVCHAALAFYGSVIGTSLWRQAREFA